MRFYVLGDPTKQFGDQLGEPVYLSDDKSLNARPETTESINLSKFLTDYSVYQIQNGIAEIMKAKSP